MMAWKGFLTESKFYMGYPGYYSDGWIYRTGETTEALEQIRGKIKFWLAFPRAWIRFHWYMLADYSHVVETMVARRVKSWQNRL